MSVDNLISADVVTANGELVHTSADVHEDLLSADVHEDLLWAIRGGGNFGVVTMFEFQLPIRTATQHLS